MGSAATKFDLCCEEEVQREYHTYKTEDKNEESNEKKRRLQYSDWKYAFGLLDIEQTTDK